MREWQEVQEVLRSLKLSPQSGQGNLQRHQASEVRDTGCAITTILWIITAVSHKLFHDYV